MRDTYGEGKWLGRQACVIPIAEQYGLNDEAAKLRRPRSDAAGGLADRGRPDGKPKSRRVFAYDAHVGHADRLPGGLRLATRSSTTTTSTTATSSRAAAEVARRDPAWAADDQYGGMVKLLIRDIATADRADPMFPFLRELRPLRRPLAGPRGTRRSATATTRSPPPRR